MKHLSGYRLCLTWAIITLLFLSRAPLHAAEKEKRILILNSYNEEVEWSRNLTHQIEGRIRALYPGIKIYKQYLKANAVYNTAALDLIMRSVAFSLENDTTRLDAERLDPGVIFSAGNRPDILVIIGEEGLLHLQRRAVSLNQWQTVPIVLCSVSGLISGSLTDMSPRPDPENMVPVETRRDIPVSSPEGTRNAGFNITGVTVSYPVKENLKLIKKLYPALKELIWVDNNYYKAALLLEAVKRELPGVLPGVQLRTIVHNRLNSDSISNVMAEPRAGTAYITFSWNTASGSGKYTPEDLHSLFTRQSHSPFFSLSELQADNNYWIGGYYPSLTECAAKTADKVFRILGGEEANSLPFTPADSIKLILNQSALKRYGKQTEARDLAGAVYVNIPANFYNEHEQYILTAMILLVILAGIIFYIRRHLLFRKELKTETKRYRRLYDKIQAIYENSAIDFALYDTAGDPVVYVIDGLRNNAGSFKKHILSENIFTNTWLSDEEKESIGENRIINRELELCGITFMFTVKPVKMKDYREAGYMAVLINIQSLVKERNERMLYESMFRFASDFSRIGIAIHYLNEDTFSATATWYQNMQEPAYPAGAPSYAALLPENRKRITSYLSRLKNGEQLPPFSEDICITDASGKKQWIKENIFHNTEYNTVTELNINIDLQKENENKLLAAKRKADLSNKEISEFINNISHEIRTPLNSIVGFMGILGSAGENKEEYIHIIKTNNEILKHLIDNILHMSKLNSGKIRFQYEPISVTGLLAGLKEEAAGYTFRKNISVAVECPKGEHTVCSDRYYIHLVLQNLLFNAFKFTDAGTIAVGYCKENNRHILYVKDTGCGIAPKDHLRIFKEFEKVNTYTQGTGLGLSLCKTIVDHMGGQIGVKSRLGEGSVFWISLS